MHGGPVVSRYRSPACRLLARAAALRHGEAALVHGWHLPGPGSARFGWALHYPAGAVRFLGEHATDALRTLLPGCWVVYRSGLDSEAARIEADETEPNRLRLVWDTPGNGPTSYSLNEILDDASRLSLHSCRIEARDELLRVMAGACEDATA
jgi:hypothetical protein